MRKKVIYITCATCGGTGRVPGRTYVPYLKEYADFKVCPTCDGYAKIPVDSLPN